MSGVCRTANYIAAARAKESERENPLIVDPWAKEFATDAGFEMLDYFSRYRMSSMFSTDSESEDITVMITAIRTKFFDHHLLEVMKKEDILQVVILGCGFDTRSCRLPFSFPEKTKVFEVDLPEVMEIRNNILGTNSSPKNIKEGLPPRAERISICADVADIELLKSKLEEASFDKDAKSVWLLEGLLVYLTEEQVHDLLHFLSIQTNPGSYVIADIHNPATMKSVYNRKYNEDWAEKGAPLIWGTDFPEDTFRWHGFNTELCCRYGDKDADFGRYLSFLTWLLDGFPRNNLTAPNTFLFVGRRDDIAADELTEWKGYLKLEAARVQVDSIKKWILPHHLRPIEECLEHFRDKLFTFDIDGDIKQKELESEEVKVESVSLDDLDEIPIPLPMDDLD